MEADSISFAAVIFLLIAAGTIACALDSYPSIATFCSSDDSTNDEHTSSTKSAAFEEPDRFVPNSSTPSNPTHSRAQPPPKPCKPYWNDSEYTPKTRSAQPLPRYEFTQSELDLARKQFYAGCAASKAQKVKLAEDTSHLYFKQDDRDDALAAAKAAKAAAAEAAIKASSINAETFSSRLRGIESSTPLSYEDIELQQLRALPPHLQTGLIGRRDDGLWHTQPAGHEPMLLDIATQTLFPLHTVFSVPIAPVQANPFLSHASKPVSFFESFAPLPPTAPSLFAQYQATQAPFVAPEPPRFFESFAIRTPAASAPFTQHQANQVPVPATEPSPIFESPAASLPAQSSSNLATGPPVSVSNPNPVVEANAAIPPPVNPHNPILRETTPAARREKAKDFLECLSNFARLNRNDPEGTVHSLQENCEDLGMKLTWVREFIEWAKTADGKYVPQELAPHHLRKWGIGNDVWKTITREMSCLACDSKWANNYLGEALRAVLSVDEAMKIGV
jgi:hypothetical protein